MPELLWGQFDLQKCTMLHATSDLQAVKSFKEGLGAAFTEAVGPRLREGAHGANDEVMGIVRGWGASWRGTGLHWATYKATCRRDGEWKVRAHERAASDHLPSWCLS